MLKPPVTKTDNAAGPADALVTLVEYGDYECPFCGEAYPIIKAIQEQMKGRLRFVFRNFPLREMHPYAFGAALATEAAARQGAFWPMHDKIFAHQARMTDTDLLTYAHQLHLNAATFSHDLTDKALVEKVEADMESGIRSGVNGTPTFFINGTRYDGSWEGNGELLHALTKIPAR